MSGLREYLAGLNDGPGGQSMPADAGQLIVLPTGELLDLTRDDNDLARAFDELRQFESRAKEIRALIGDELRRRMDLAATWSRRCGDFEVKAPSPAPTVEYDVEALREGLAMLVAEGLISGEAAARAVERRVSYKPLVRGLNQLRKLGGRVADVVDGCSTEVPRERRLVVTRRPG